MPPAIDDCWVDIIPADEETAIGKNTKSAQKLVTAVVEWAGHPCQNLRQFAGSRRADELGRDRSPARQSQPRVMQRTTVRTDGDRAGLAVETFSACPKATVHLAHQTDQSGLAHLRQPDEANLLVDARPIEMTHETACGTAVTFVVYSGWQAAIGARVALGNRLRALRVVTVRGDDEGQHQPRNRTEICARNDTTPLMFRDVSDMDTNLFLLCAEWPAGPQGERSDRPFADQPPPVPNCTMAGASLMDAWPPDAVTDALLIQTPAVANRPQSTRPAMPLPMLPVSRFCG